MKKLLIVTASAMGIIVFNKLMTEGSSNADETIFDALLSTFDVVTETTTGVLMAKPVEEMQTSESGKNTLKKSEGLSLKRYELGDGGVTIGYGHYEKYGSKIPDTITKDQADAMFEDDVITRAEKWVKLYVTVPLEQNQFDALVSLAFNMSPQSFKKFAADVNAGYGIEAMAQKSISWVADKFKSGIENRRNREVNLFNAGIYA